MMTIIPHLQHTFPSQPPSHNKRRSELNFDKDVDSITQKLTDKTEDVRSLIDLLEDVFVQGKQDGLNALINTIRRRGDSVEFSNAVRTQLWSRGIHFMQTRDQGVDMSVALDTIQEIPRTLAVDETLTCLPESLTELISEYDEQVAFNPKNKHGIQMLLRTEPYSKDSLRTDAIQQGKESLFSTYQQEVVAASTDQKSPSAIKLLFKTLLSN